MPALPSANGLAWQRAYERMAHAMLRDGVDLMEIANASMPSEIRESDYVVVTSSGGPLQVLLVRHPLPRRLSHQPRRASGRHQATWALTYSKKTPTNFCTTGG